MINMTAKSVDDLFVAYNSVKPTIERRIDDFRALGERGDPEDIFSEAVFCLLTPQSKAKSCWAAVEELRKKGLLWMGDAAEIARVLRGYVRFHNTKARRVVEIRKNPGPEGLIEILRVDNPMDMRDSLVGTVDGMGYKEASHFLRNVGVGEDLAILDRHILKNLVSLGVIDGTPRSLTPGRYLETEEKMRLFASEIGIPVAHLDLLFWYMETGEVFK